MSCDHEVRLAADRGKLPQRRADVNIHYAMAFHASNVMMMLVSANAVVMAAIWKFNAVQQSQVNQLLDRSKYCGSSEARVGATEFMPEILHRKIGFPGSHFRQTVGNLTFRDCLPLPRRLERRPYSFTH